MATAVRSGLRLQSTAPCCASVYSVQNDTDLTSRLSGLGIGLAYAAAGSDGSVPALLVLGAPLTASPGGQAVSGVVLTLTPAPSGGYTRIGDVLEAGSGGEEFGWAVALLGRWLFVAAPTADSGRGQLAVYQWSAGPPPRWDGPHRLSKPLASTNEFFGQSVASMASGADGCVLAVGTPGASVSGGVQLFAALPLTAATDLAPVQFVVPPTTNYRNFGTAVAMHGAMMAVGAPDTAGTGRSAVFVFAVSTSGSASLLHVLAGAEDFGAAVCLHGSRLVVGLPSAGAAGEGSASAFVLSAAGHTPTRDTAFDAAVQAQQPAPSAGAKLGSSCSVVGDTVAVGAPDHLGDGAVWVHSYNGAVWASSTGLVVADTPSATRDQLTEFGSALHLRQLSAARLTLVATAPLSFEGVGAAVTAEVEVPPPVSDSSSLSAGAIAAIIVCSSVAVATVVLLVAWYRHKASSGNAVQRWPDDPGTASSALADPPAAQALLSPSAGRKQPGGRLDDPQLVPATPRRRGRQQVLPAPEDPGGFSTPVGPPATHPGVAPAAGGSGASVSGGLAALLLRVPGQVNDGGAAADGDAGATVGSVGDQSDGVGAHGVNATEPPPDPVMPPTTPSPGVSPHADPTVPDDDDHMDVVGVHANTGGAEPGVGHSPAIVAAVVSSVPTLVTVSFTISTVDGARLPLSLPAITSPQDVKRLAMASLRIPFEPNNALLLLGSRSIDEHPSLSAARVADGVDLLLFCRAQLPSTTAAGSSVPQPPTRTPVSPPLRPPESVATVDVVFVTLDDHRVGVSLPVTSTVPDVKATAVQEMLLPVPPSDALLMYNEKLVPNHHGSTLATLGVRDGQEIVVLVPAKLPPCMFGRHLPTGPGMPAMEPRAPEPVSGVSDSGGGAGSGSGAAAGGGGGGGGGSTDVAEAASPHVDAAAASPVDDAADEAGVAATGTAVEADGLSGAGDDDGLGGGDAAAAGGAGTGGGGGGDASDAGGGGGDASDAGGGGGDASNAGGGASDAGAGGGASDGAADAGAEDSDGKVAVTVFTQADERNVVVSLPPDATVGDLKREALMTLNPDGDKETAFLMQDGLPLDDEDTIQEVVSSDVTGLRLVVPV